MVDALRDAIDGCKTLMTKAEYVTVMNIATLIQTRAICVPKRPEVRWLRTEKPVNRDDSLHGYTVHNVVLGDFKGKSVRYGYLNIRMITSNPLDAEVKDPVTSRYCKVSLPKGRGIAYPFLINDGFAQALNSPDLDTRVKRYLAGVVSMITKSCRSERENKDREEILVVTKRALRHTTRCF